jgi:hypothetical protein
MMSGGGESSGPAIPKSQLMSIMTQVRRRLLHRMLEAKRANIRERMQYYKTDAEQYRACIARFMHTQPQLVNTTFQEVMNEQGVSPQSFALSLRQNMVDPEVQAKLGGMQTITADMCEGLPVPPELTKDRFKEAIRSSIEELRKYTVNDVMSSLLAQTASADEVNLLHGFDEVTICAAMLKFENDPDEELKQLRDQWNEASQFLTYMGQQPGEAPPS